MSRSPLGLTSMAASIIHGSNRSYHSQDVLGIDPNILRLRYLSCCDIPGSGIEHEGTWGRQAHASKHP